METTNTEDRYGFGWRATGRSVAEAMRIEGLEETTLCEFVREMRSSDLCGFDDEGGEL